MRYQIEALKPLPGLKLSILHIGYHHGQHEYTLLAMKDGKSVGYISFSDFDDVIQIDMMEVKSEVRRQGVAMAMLQYLAKHHGPYKKIKWGYTTKEAVALKKIADRVIK